MVQTDKTKKKIQKLYLLSCETGASVHTTQT